MTVYLMLFLAMGISAGLIVLGFKMGRTVQGQGTRIFSTKPPKAPYEDEAGGMFEDHVAGGKYDQIEEAEKQGRIQTI